MGDLRARLRLQGFIMGIFPTPAYMGVKAYASLWGYEGMCLRLVPTPALW